MTSAGEAPPEAPMDVVIEHYDQQYAEGGFGYQAQRERWAAWVRRHYIDEFELRPGETLLDVGCGDGFWTDLFAEAGFPSTGVDFSPGGIEVARTAYPTPTFLVGDAEDLPFADDTFDIVFTRAISHLSRPDLFTDASRRLMASMRRVVRPGGLILISFYSRRDGGGTAEHAWHRVSDLVRLMEGVADPYHVDVTGNYVQIAAQRWDAPRARSGRTRQSPQRSNRTPMSIARGGLRRALAWARRALRGS